MLLSAREAVVGQMDAGGLFDERWCVTEAVICVECCQWEALFRGEFPWKKTRSFENYADKYPTRTVGHVVMKWRVGRPPDCDTPRSEFIDKGRVLLLQSEGETKKGVVSIEL